MTFSNQSEKPFTKKSTNVRKKLLLFALCNSFYSQTAQNAQIEKSAQDKTYEYVKSLISSWPVAEQEVMINFVKQLFPLKLSQEQLENEIKIKINDILSKQNSLLNKILVDMILKTIIVTFVQKMVEVAWSILGNKFEGANLLMKQSRETTKTLNLLFVEEQNPIRLLETNINKLILSENVSQIFYSIITELNSLSRNKKHLISLQPLIIFAGVGGTGKTSLAFLIQQYMGKKYKKRSTIFTKFREFLPTIIQSMFNLYENDKILNLTISGSYFFNQSDFDKSANMLENMLQSVTHYISGHPERVAVVVVEEGENICNIPQFVTVLKGVTAIWERLHQTKRKNGNRANGIVLMIITTNHGSDVNNYLSRRALYVQFTPPSEVDKLYILTKYLESGLGKGYYTSTIKDYITDIIRLCERFSPSDIENIISLLSYNKNLLQSIVTLLDILKIIEDTLVKMQTVVYKEGSDGENRRREVLNIKRMLANARKAQEFFLSQITDTKALSGEIA